MKRLFIVGFPKGKDEEWFRELFGRYGIVTQIEIVKNEKLSQNLGYGFITMQDLSSANAAIAALNSNVIEGLMVGVKEAYGSTI